MFVAGTTGVIGRRTVDRLVAAEHEVTAVASSEPKAEHLRRAGAVPVRVDLFDAAAVRIAAEGHDAVVNLATNIPSVNRMARRRAWATNDRLRTEASRTLVGAALATGASRYVQESIVLLYADGGDRWLDEAAGVDAARMTASALAAEEQARRPPRQA